jgi:5'-nucleotidase
MRILITNDDSVYAEGLAVLAKLAQDYGEVFIIAPLKGQSAKSHAINVQGGFSIESIDLGLEVETYACDSTPADCVRSAKWGLHKEFDLVFSGINSGLNVGEDISYSGTVAAATEAALLGKMGIAFSASETGLCYATRVFGRIMDYIMCGNLLGVGKLYNINVPDNPKEIMITRQGSTHFDTWFEKKSDLYYQKGHHQYHLENDEHTDTWAVSHGYISVTPLNFDRTDFDIYRKLNK